MAERAIVVGSGLAGLAAACRLARSGVETHVVEKRDEVGGYCSGLDFDGHRFDVGATMLQTPEVLTDLFEDLGRDAHDYLDLEPLDPLYEIRLSSGESIVMRPDVDATAESIGRVSAPDADGFRRYVADLDKLKRTLKQVFIERKGNRLVDYLSPEVLAVLRKLLPWKSVEDLMRGYFKSPAVRSALSFQTLYWGTSPARCPAAYGMVPYFEVTQGVWHSRGGLNTITAALARILEEEGGTIETSAEVERILVSGGAARGVLMRDGRVLQADRVVSNADAVYTLRNLVPESELSRFLRWRVDRAQLSCAPLLTMLSVDAERIGLGVHHTFFLPSDLAGVCHDVFTLGQMPREFWCYACYPTVTDTTMAPAGRGSLYVLACVPYAGSGPQPEGGTGSRYALDGLAERGIGGLEGARVMATLGPAEYETEFNQPQGMGFGLQPTLRQVGPMRPGPHVPSIAGLYLAGASTNPGAGIPLVVASGRSAAAAVLADVEAAAGGAAAGGRGAAGTRLRRAARERVGAR